METNFFCQEDDKIVFMKDRLKLYNNFHGRIKPQKRVINKNNFTYRNLLGLLEKYLHGVRTCLDIGCGSGSISLFVASRGKKVLGIDISETSIKACREGAQGLRLEDMASFKVMDFPKESPKQKFGLVICSEVLEHIREDKRALKKIYRLLNPDGLLIISVPSENAPLYKIGIAKKFDARVGHLRRYNANQLVGFCKEMGFNILNVERTEGILRNFLFLNPTAGRAIRFIRGPISDFIAALDNISLRFFGESQIFVIAQKSPQKFHPNNVVIKARKPAEP